MRDIFPLPTGTETLSLPVLLRIDTKENLEHADFFQILKD
jgi:hypothetical protein